MFVLNGKRINIYAQFETDDGTRYANLINPDVRASVGVQEIPDPVPPEDYSDETYYRTEQDTEPYVVFTRKSDEQLEALRVSKVNAKLTAIRQVREGILNRLAGIALAAGLAGDDATTAAFVAVRKGLLDITTDLPTNPADIDAAVVQRYAALVAKCTPAMAGAFNQVDA
jgi:hypothetical protein